ncbi:MAG: amidohydrolase family protein [Gemmatimonadetes bacterium]|nr:amidohydrolase family protein [Gemmatimonadota bacterium]
MSSTAPDLLIRGGTVVDGTNAPAFRADVRLRDGLIAEVAEGLEPVAGERVVDATGCYVTPGLIESHTHFDGTMWWQPDLDPLPGCGVTTVVMGNCGFALAPLNDDPAVREEVVKIFSFFEDIPEIPFLNNLPWDWRTWSEYKQSLTSQVRVPANYAAFVGHIALRLAVMGMDAWERAATEDEIRQIAALLDDALSAGALGMSTNLMDHDGSDRPVPSLHADDAELIALFEVVARHPGTSVQVVVDSIMRMTALPSMERLARLTDGMPIRVQWAGVPTLQWQKDFGLQQPLFELHERFAKEGRDFWTGFTHVPITTTASIDRSLLFAQSGDYVWHEVVQAEGDEAKIAVLRDPDWRVRARHSWDVESNEIAPFRKPRGVVLDNSQNGVGPVGITLGEYADSLGVHCSDALAEWFIHNGLESTVTMPPWDKDDEMVLRLIRDPKTVGNITDAGAHGQLFCGSGDNLMLYTHYVREAGTLSIEEAVHCQTGKLAEHFGLHDRGQIAVGKRADVTVFDLDEIERREKRKVSDVPDGKGGVTWRWTRDPAPMRLTVTNGIPTFDEGKATGARPGEMVGPISA